MSEAIDVKMLNNMLPEFGRLIGMTIIEANKDLIVGEMKVSDDLLNQPGRINGGALMGFADTLGAMGTMVNLKPDQWTTTIESKTNFLRAAGDGPVVRGEARPVHKGGKTHVWRTDMFNESGKLAATVTQTQMILEQR